MALEDDIATLSGAPLFNLLGVDALRLVAFASETRSLRAGDVLFRKGERSDGGFVVKSGAIALDRREDGSPPAYVAGPGAVIGRTALFAAVARPATAAALEPSTVIRVSRNLMRRVLEEFPDAATAMRAALEQDLAALADGLEEVRRKFIAIDGDPEG